MDKVRERMKQYREENHISLSLMSDITGVSSGLLAHIEGGYVTHPKIAKQIKNGYKLTDEEAEMLVPEIHRPSSEKYDPDKFRDPDDPKNMKLLPRRNNDEIDFYLSELKGKKGWGRSI